MVDADLVLVLSCPVIRKSNTTTNAIAILPSEKSLPNRH